MLSNKPNTAILIGTYNGARFVHAQIESIRHQIGKKCRIFISDEASTDNTVDVIKKIACQDKRVVLVASNTTRLGVIQNYDRLFHAALDWGAERVFISDQDDIWCPGKLRLQHERIDQLEKTFGQSCPVLVHTDLFVVDVRLQPIHNSFFNFQGLKPEKNNSINFLIAQNHVTGCTCAFNRALLKIAAPIPDSAVIHDWWLALCAATFGRIEMINKPLTLYRQHENNVVGVKKIFHMLEQPNLKKILRQWRAGTTHFKQSFHQAAALQLLIAEHPQKISPDIKQLINVYAACRNQGRLERFGAIIKNNIRRQGILFQFSFYLRLLSTTTS